jgi:hypothetical protein
MLTVRARFDGKVFVPEKAIQLPVGEIVEIQYTGSHPAELGMPSAILHAMKTLPKVSAEDVAEMERLIDEGASKTDFTGVFDDMRDADK